MTFKQVYYIEHNKQLTKNIFMHYCIYLSIHHSVQNLPITVTSRSQLGGAVYCAALGGAADLFTMQWTRWRCSRFLGGAVDSFTV